MIFCKYRQHFKLKASYPNMQTRSVAHMEVMDVKETQWQSHTSQQKSGEFQKNVFRNKYYDNIHQKILI